MAKTIFCPDCSRLILTDDTCPECGWLRPGLEPVDGQLIWQQTLEEQLSGPYCVFVTTGQRLILGAQRNHGFQEQTGTIIALKSQSGHEAWRFPLAAGRVARILALSEGIVYIGSQDTRTVAPADNALVALDAGTGELLWRFPASAHSLSSPAILGDTLFFTTNNGLGYALDTQQGGLKWQVENLPPWSPEPPAIGADCFFVSSVSPTITQIDARDGSHASLYEGPAAYSAKAVYHQGTLYAYCWDRHLYAIDVNARSLRWRVPMSRGASSPPVIGPYLYVGIKATNQAGAPSYGLHALDLDTGAEAWQFETARHVQAPPLVHGNALLLGDRTGMLSVLDALTGELQWTYKAPAAIISQPATTAGRIYVGTKKGELLALAAPEATGPEPDAAEAYRAQEQWELAGTAAALSGDYAAAAADFERLGNSYQAAQLFEQAEGWSAAATSYLAAARPAKAAVMFRRAGNHKGEADALADSGDPAAAAAIYSDLGLFAEAAAHFEMANQFDQAVAHYLKAGQPQEASRLAVAMGESLQAARILLEAGASDPAVEIIRQTTSLVEGGELLLSFDQTVEAAALFQEAGELRRAADLFEQLGQLETASDLYERLGDPGALERLGAYQTAAELYLAQQPPMTIEAARCWLAADQPEEARRVLADLPPSQPTARLLEQSGAFTAASQAWVQLDDLDEAAAVLRRAGADTEALDLLIDHGAWSQARSLASELQDHRREAQACLALATDERWDTRITLYECAAEALVKAATEVEAEDPDDAAGLYEQASHYFERALNGEQATICRQESRRLRKWPSIDLTYQPEGSLVAEKWGAIVVNVTNSGYGPARLISLRVIGNLFSGDSEYTQQLEGLLPQKSRPVLLRVRPKHEAVGDAVPLDFQLSYMLPNDKEIVREIRGKVEVLAMSSAVSRAARLDSYTYTSIDPDVAQRLLTLQRQIADNFNDSELRDMCFELGIRYDFLRGETLPDKVWSLVDFCQRHDRVSALRQKCLQLRPHLEF